jgi:hypothetical protein
MIILLCTLHSFCFMITLKHSLLISSNDAAEKALIGPTHLHEVFRSCNFVLLLFICENVWNKLSARIYPFSKFLCRNCLLINIRLILHQLLDHSTVSDLQFMNFCNCFWILGSWWPSTARTIFKVLAPLSDSFNSSKDTHMRLNFISTNSFKHTICCCSCFPEFDEKQCSLTAPW